MTIQTKIAKLPMHENLYKMLMKTFFHSHFYANFHEFLAHLSRRLQGELLVYQ